VENINTNLLVTSEYYFPFQLQLCSRKMRFFACHLNIAEIILYFVTNYELILTFHEISVFPTLCFKVMAADRESSF